MSAGIGLWLWVCCGAECWSGRALIDELGMRSGMMSFRHEDEVGYDELCMRLGMLA